VDKPGSIVQLQSEIASLDALPQQIEALREQRLAKACEIHGQIQAMVDDIVGSIFPFNASLAPTSKREMNLPLDFQVRIEESDFASQFMKH